MLCVTGREPSAEALRARLGRVAALAPDALQEVRLDALAAAGDDLFAALAGQAGRGAGLLACCRSLPQGGRLPLEREERARRLLRAAEGGAAWVDLDYPDDLDLLSRFGGAGGARTILSFHDFAGTPAGLESVAAKMAAAGPDLVKIAVATADAAELPRLRRLARGLARPCLAVGMGLAGLLSRVRYPWFGSPWTYVAAEEAEGTAPGQLSLAGALALGLPGAAREPFLALVGGATVALSPGPRVYNRLFRALGANLSYVAVQTEKAQSTFNLLAEMGARGAGVTMPHKAAALASGRPDETARRVGAANTLRFSAAGHESFNTDVTGVREPLRKVLGAAPAGAATALVLGAGGAARAAGAACEDLGLRVAYAVRDERRAAAALPAGSRCVPWARRTESPADVLVNATPLSGDDCPWPEDAPLRAGVVFDLALAPGPGRLLERAKSAGAATLAPLEMWLHQGAAQLRLLAGLEADAETLRRYLS